MDLGSQPSVRGRSLVVDLGSSPLQHGTWPVADLGSVPSGRGRSHVMDQDSRPSSKFQKLVCIFIDYVLIPLDLEGLCPVADPGGGGGDARPHAGQKKKKEPGCANGCTAASALASLQPAPRPHCPTSRIRWSLDVLVAYDEVHLIRKTLQGFRSEAGKKFEWVYADMLKMAKVAGRPENWAYEERASDKLNDPTSLLKPQRIIGGALSSCLFRTACSQNSAPDSLPWPKRLWEDCVFFPNRRRQWVSNGCALTCFRPMNRICQRRNTSTRSFGFGRPSGAASRLRWKFPARKKTRWRVFLDKSVYFRMFCKSWSCCWSPPWQPRLWSVLTRPGIRQVKPQQHDVSGALECTAAPVCPQGHTIEFRS